MGRQDFDLIKLSWSWSDILISEVEGRHQILITTKLKLGDNHDDILYFVCLFICCLLKLKRELTNLTYISVIYTKNAIF